MKARRGARRAGRVGALLAGLALVATGVKLTSMVWISSSGAAAYADGEYRSAWRAFDRLGVLNVVEPWRAPFGRGAALYRVGNLQAAGTEFGEALDLAPERCEIRFNLVVTMEALGDSMIGDERAVESIENVSPLELYRTALDVIGAAPCPQRRADDAGARLEEARLRIIEKLGGEDADLPSPNLGDDPPPESEENQTSTRSATDELQQRNQAGAQERDLAREVGNQDYELSAQNEW